jgi:ParB-like chromosome segregation protein Spo0J
MPTSETPALLLPVSNVRLVQRDSLIPNDYNPNVVLAGNLDLLERSILTNGWTLPIVIRPDLTIIDGFHRWTVAGREPLKSKLRGLVPVVTVDHRDPAANIYGTITHNRARGVHQLGPMKSIVKRLMDEGKTVQEIGRQLGMRPEEVFRLSDFNRDDFLAIMAKGAEQYSPAKLFVKL